MNCRICNQSLHHILTMSDMPAMAQCLSDTPEAYKADLHLCQCTGCGLVQLDNEPVWYWNEEIRTDIISRKKFIAEVMSDANFSSFNRLEHMPDPNKYLSQFVGIGIIEVPNFDMILAKNLFAEITLDHLMYFTEDTFRFALQYNGFTVHRIESVFNDYILSAVVERRKPVSLLQFATQREKLKIALDNYINRYEHVAIYGASHQAFAYIATLNPKVEFIVDDSPLKQGKYSPVGGLAIYPARELYKADAVIIMGAGYSDEIASKLDFEGGVAIMRSWGLEVIK